MNARPISISTLSPVHVGCDDVYEPSNFVIANGLLHALEPADLAADLSENDRNQLSALAEGHEPIAALQRFFRKNAQRFAELSHHQVTVAEAIVGEYEKTAGKATQRGPAGEATYNLFPIARTAYRPFDAAAYLPGSSLKGSIRTAWLNHCNEGTLAADALLATVRELCCDDNCALHVSIAGGRKTMGFFLGYALSLFGRAQDRLSHVLVNEPFESLRNFYFPPLQPCVLHTATGRPVHTGDARIMLADIPYVRLRDGLPADALAHPTPFASLISAAQLSLEPPSLDFDLRHGTVRCGSQQITLPPSLLAWYAWLAECRVTGKGEDGFVRHSDTTPERYLAIYERIVGRSHPSLIKARQATRDGLDHTQFEQKRSKINRKLSAALSLASAPYEVSSSGKRPFTRYGISIPPARIQIRSN